MDILSNLIFINTLRLWKLLGGMYTMQASNHYRADLRDSFFLLFEHFKIQDVILEQSSCEDLDEATCKEIFVQVYRFAQEVLGPLNSIGDREGCRLEDGKVFCPKGYREAWKKIYEAGWTGISVPTSYGGMGGPATLGVLANEFIAGSNSAFSIYTGLTLGVVDLLIELGTDDQKNVFVDKLLRGQWAGTMCLTEPHAGSDVGSAITSATHIGDGNYRIKGTKIYISGETTI